MTARTDYCSEAPIAREDDGSPGSVASSRETEAASSLEERLRRARIDVRSVCAMLRRPTAEVLDQCSILLEATARVLAGGRPEPDGNGAALQEARQLLAAVRHARILLNSAFAFRQAWSRRFSAITAGYTIRGEPARWDRGFRLVVRG